MSHRCQPDPSFRHPNFRTSFWGCEVRSPVSPRAKQAKKSLASRVVICTVSDFPKIMRRSREQWDKCARPVLLPRQFNGRLSPMNLSRPSSFATANAPEASPGSSEEGGSAQASVQRTSHATVAGSQQKVKSRHQMRRSSLQKKSRATRSGSQSSSGRIAARARKPMRAEMMSFAVVSEALGRQKNLTGSGRSVEHSEKQ